MSWPRKSSSAELPLPDLGIDIMERLVGRTGPRNKISGSDISHPDQSLDVSVGVGIWRMCVFKEAQRATARVTMGGEYKHDVMINQE